MIAILNLLECSWIVGSTPLGTINLVVTNVMHVSGITTIPGPDHKREKIFRCETYEGRHKKALIDIRNLWRNLKIYT